MDLSQSGLASCGPGTCTFSHVHNTYGGRVTAENLHCL